MIDIQNIAELNALSALEDATASLKKAEMWAEHLHWKSTHGSVCAVAVHAARHAIDDVRDAIIDEENRA